MVLNIGIDIGSTTVKVVVLDSQQHIVFHTYQRHLSKVREKTLEILEGIQDIVGHKDITVSLSGSAGLGVAKACNLPFIQEVYATKLAVDRYIPDTDVVIELGGEDAKIIFLTGGLEERMNGSCAGGTGAFIDQMATLLGVTVSELDELSQNSEKIYKIASRCGVFAKTDIQPLLNQGATKEDIAASIYRAVVDQTVTGLSQGRKIEGRVAFLGGPLTFIKGLRTAFVHTLKLDENTAIFPPNAQYYVALGAADYSKKQSSISYQTLLDNLRAVQGSGTPSNTLPPLFADTEDYEAFVTRHAKSNVRYRDISGYTGKAYLGIDAGSTTTKLVLLSEDQEILYHYYAANNGNPVSLIKEQLGIIYQLCGDRIKLCGSAVTGYGEELIKNAFSVDLGLVETMAHYGAAKYFNSHVDFILDIGGQDIKCFKIRNNAIDSIVLNEACSSGCGSFLETFAKSLGYTVMEFAQLGLSAKNPVDLGSRCTVFMNSSVKQAQKEGACVADISAGLSISVVKNAVYKVIRAHSAKDLGQHIVVQGGTLLNDAVLRAFELEIGADVTRPVIAGLMGAFGAALAAKQQQGAQSTLISPEDLEKFDHQAKGSTCNGCTNRCHLTINIFDGNRRYISGNRCEKPTGHIQSATLPNLFEYKLSRIMSMTAKEGRLGKIGLPLGLNMYENGVFWHTFLTEIGFEVIWSGSSNRRLYSKGQYTIPSDTVCYPAKLLHGHLEMLREQGITRIFYPCMPYNFDEKMGDNHFNCPVVAYYPELLDANVEWLKEIDYMMPYLTIYDKKLFIKKACEYFCDKFSLSAKMVIVAAKAAYEAHDLYVADIRVQGEQAIAYARQNGLPIVVLAGRPYHVDPEINHGIDKLITSLGLVVISEDTVAYKMPKEPVRVLNQWTYHARLYAAARYVAQNDDMQLIQLVSFGCGLDAITTDEVRDILEQSGKIYTQLKIDEISNLGAVKIRIRSLIEAMKTKGASK